MFVGATGPFIAPFFLRDDFEKEEVIATKAACQMVGHGLKIPAVLIIGFEYSAHLPLLGLLVAGVILGRFTRRKEEPPDKPGYFTMEEVLEQYFKNFNVPVVKNFPAGHVRTNISLPLGVPAELDTEQGVLRLLESPTVNRDR